MRIHALEATGGLVYSQMGQYLDADGKPTDDKAQAAIDPKTKQPVANGARNTWVNETALSTALNTSYFAENVALFSIVMGIALLLTGAGFAVLTLGLLPRRGTTREPVEAVGPTPVTALTTARLRHGAVAQPAQDLRGVGVGREDGVEDVLDGARGDDQRQAPVAGSGRRRRTSAGRSASASWRLGRKAARTAGAVVTAFGLIFGGLAGEAVDPRRRRRRAVRRGGRGTRRTRACSRGRRGSRPSRRAAPRRAGRSSGRRTGWSGRRRARRARRCRPWWRPARRAARRPGRWSAAPSSAGAGRSLRSWVGSIMGRICRAAAPPLSETEVPAIV